MKLGALKPNKGATHAKKRLGCGESSGHGKTSGRGHKGQRARSGCKLRPEFEGGQLPLIRRLPKRGFTYTKKYTQAVVGLESLNVFEQGSVVDLAALKDKGLIAKTWGVRVKVLGNGDLKHALTIKAHAFSASALEKINQAGGTAEPVEKIQSRPQEAC